jgi:hypothetical protein
MMLGNRRISRFATAGYMDAGQAGAVSLTQQAFGWMEIEQWLIIGLH